MPRKRIQELPRRRVEQPHVRVEGGNQERRGVCRWDDRGNRLCGREGKCERAKRGRGGHRTSNEICAELALAEVVRADVAVHGTGDDGRRVDVEGLHGIAGILEHLDRRAGLGSRRGEERRGGRGGDVPYVPQPDRRIVRTCPLESARRPSLHVRSRRTAREHAGVRVELDGVYFAHVPRQSAGRHRRRDVPDKDGPVSARRRKLGIVVAPGRHGQRRR